MTDTERINNLEEALILFMSILTGQPEGLSTEEKNIMQNRLAHLMEEMSKRYVISK